MMGETHELSQDSFSPSEDKGSYGRKGGDRLTKGEKTLTSEITGGIGRIGWIFIVMYRGECDL